MTPLRKRALDLIEQDAREGRALIVAGVARRLSVDRRSARRILTDLRTMGTVPI